MKQLLRPLIIAACGLAFLPVAVAQTADTTDASFTSENAILDTSILFAIGAHEARQELRGSFGWPTFQEGLVDGVYFRFDPDGYARFAPTPRLDTDVFEVICRPRTFTCMGRKGMMSIILTPQGLPQLELDGVSPSDLFFVADGVSELQIPGRVLQPLDPHLEALLSAGGELVARRGLENEINRVSLTGFSAVATYLRWINARQDYTVLPRNWPVPNSPADPATTGLTQTADWHTARPQPQNQPILAANPTSLTPAPGAEVAEVRQELDSLRQLLMERGAQNLTQATEQYQTTLQHAPATDNIQQLEQAAAQILHDLELLKSQQMILNRDQINAMSGIARPEGALENAAMTTGEDIAATQTPQSDAGRMSDQLEYLMTEIGLDAQTALLLIQLRDAQETPSAILPAIADPAQSQQSDAVELILQELQDQLGPADLVSPPAADSAENAHLPPQDYQLLSDYFSSVFVPPEGPAK